MPATNFSWTGSKQSPIFHTFGLKRKYPTDESQLESQGEDINPRRKRACADSHIQSVLTPMTEEEESMEASEPETVSSYTADANSRVPVILDPTGDHASNNNNIILEMNNNINGSTINQNDMIMDLSDEVYTNFTLPLNDPHIKTLTPGVGLQATTDAEYEAACSMMTAMEGEGSPNPQQYKMAYCDQYCIGGQRSPSSGVVRCLCKPSWEGLHDIRPYVSDYY
ncbi:uncharacterized protein LOC127836703 isoform X2 [Dreissena polymorpha]|nr:uncharacterized protein LOC127836703 isoform X2 [Dreissena polymorpha]